MIWYVLLNPRMYVFNTDRHERDVNIWMLISVPGERYQLRPYGGMGSFLL